MNNEAFSNFINQDFNSLNDWLYSLNPYEFTLIGNSIAYLIAKTLTINEQNSLGNLFALIGQVLQTINAQSITKIQRNKPTNNFKPYIQKDSIEEELKFLKEELYIIIQDIYNNTSY